jgi:hypothetical protein
MQIPSNPFTNWFENRSVKSTKPCYFAGLLVFLGEKRCTELVEVFLPSEMTSAEPAEVNVVEVSPIFST